MAGFRDIVANGVALADSLTASLQVTVQFEAWIGQDGFGQSQFAPAVPVQALVERKSKMVRTPTGEERLASHTITVLRPLAPNGAPGREEPIDGRDRFTLADGTTGPILAVEGLDDPVTTKPYFAQVFLASRQ